MPTFTYNSILLKSKSKNKKIKNLLNTLKREVFCYIILKLKIFTYFVHFIQQK